MDFINLLCLTIVNVLLVVNGQSSIEDETTIECLKLSECTTIYNAVKNGTFQADKAALVNVCGLDGVEIKVWCPIIHQSCETPDGKRSMCRTIVGCPQFYNATKYLSEEKFVAILPKYTCQTTDGIFRVCCPDYNLTTEDIMKMASDNLISGVQQTTETPEPTSATVRSSDADQLTRLPAVSSGIDLLPDPLKSECGTDSNEDRIANGFAADLRDFPWLALLEYEIPGNRRSAICGGTLINDRYVLTAAHCLERRSSQKLYVVLGEYNRTSDPDCATSFDGTVKCAPPTQTIAVDERIVHPQWAKAEPQFYADIALLRLRDKVQLNTYVQPICLPTTNVSRKQTRFTIAGFGKTESGALSDVKRRGDISLRNDTVCSDLFKRPIDGQLCVGRSGNKVADTCTGDSGGPLMYLQRVKRRVVWFQAGVTSLGHNTPCGHHPALYTYVPRYLQWIYANLRP